MDKHSWWIQTLDLVHSNQDPSQVCLSGNGTPAHQVHSKQILNSSEHIGQTTFFEESNPVTLTLKIATQSFHMTFHLVMLDTSYQVWLQLKCSLVQKMWGGQTLRIRTLTATLMIRSHNTPVHDDAPQYQNGCKRFCSSEDTEQSNILRIWTPTVILTEDSN